MWECVEKCLLKSALICSNSKSVDLKFLSVEQNWSHSLYDVLRVGQVVGILIEFKRLLLSYPPFFITLTWARPGRCQLRVPSTSSTLLKNNAKRHCKLFAHTQGNFYFMIENLHVAQNKTKSVLISRKTLKIVHNILVNSFRDIWILHDSISGKCQLLGVKYALCYHPQNALVTDYFSGYNEWL